MSIAILSGTFDPIHNGHLSLGRIVRNTFQIEELRLVPAFQPPHKRHAEITSPFHRFAMVALAIQTDPHSTLSALESDSLEPQYTVDTLQAMHQSDPDTDLLFIIGTDMYQEIEEWKDYRRLLTLASFAVVHRPGFPMHEDISPFRTVDASDRILVGSQPTVYYLPWVEQNVSSTEIRDRAAGDGRIDTWVPPGVAAYIRKHHLYQTHD